MAAKFDETVSDKFCSLINARLEITTLSGTFEGILKFISEHRVTFEHVYELPEREYLGTMHILFSSILSWSRLESDAENFDFDNFVSYELDSVKDPKDLILANFVADEKLVSAEFSVTKRIDKSEVVEIPIEKCFLDFLPENLKNKCPNDFCIIDKTDDAFHRVLKHLFDSPVIGTSFHGPKVSRAGSLSWLCLATPLCIFLFDIDKLGKSAFQEGLKNFFEDENIEKVIHDCREATDGLLHLFDTDIKHIFDTQAADYLINMQICKKKKVFKYVNSLDSCLFKYLKIPQQFLYNHDESILFADKVKFYQKRPISKNFLNVLLKSSMYLLLLKEEQENCLMSPYKQAVELHLNSVRSASDSEVRMMLKTHKDYQTPSWLYESIKSINFLDIPQPPKDDFLKQMEKLPHGRKPFPKKERPKHIIK